MIVLEQPWLNSGRWLYSGKSGCIRAKWVYSGKSGCIRAKVVLFGKVVAFGQMSLI